MDPLAIIQTYFLDFLNCFFHYIKWAHEEKKSKQILQYEIKLTLKNIHFLGHDIFGFSNRLRTAFVFYLKMNFIDMT